MYSNYQQYQQRGGKLPEDEYKIKAQKASELIDYYTMGRARLAAEMREPLAACECELIQTVLVSSSGARAGIRSESNDGYSVTYADRKELEGSTRSVLSRYLAFPVNLLEIAGRAFV